MKKILLFLIFVLAFFFRFNKLNWDQNFHLHPDERFLTMVTQTMKMPQTVEEYFDQKKSLLNPPNIGFDFYVYGIFPLVLTKYLAVNFAMDDYNKITILGRFLSAFFDFMIVVLVYKTTSLLIKKFKKTLRYNFQSTIPPLATFFYALSVYPIQSAHFFTTDTFLNFFMFASFYLILKSIDKDRFLYLFLSSLCFSLALSSKISAFYLLPLNLGLLFIKVLFKKTSFFEKITRFTLSILIYLFFSYLLLRIFNPYYFENQSFLDLRLNNNFVDSLRSLILLSRADVWYPPGVQWIDKPWHSLLLTTFLVGLGPLNFTVALSGLLFLLWNSIQGLKDKKSKLRGENFIILFIIVWVIGYFIYQSSQFVKSIRYTIYLYPFLAIFGGWGVGLISFFLLSIFKKNKLLSYLLLNVLYFLLIIWPLLFSTIYFRPHTRVEASAWIYKNLENNSVILGEHWDDPLPLPMEKNHGKTFYLESLPVFDPDTPEKWQKMKALFKRSDYYVLSSNRGWGSISNVPSRYPLMSQFYQGLLNEDCDKQKKLIGECFKKIKTFEPYYYKILSYPNGWVEEAFTVYDHPTVLIYKKK